MRGLQTRRKIKRTCLVARTRVGHAGTTQGGGTLIDVLFAKFRKQFYDLLYLTADPATAADATVRDQVAIGVARASHRVLY